MNADTEIVSSVALMAVDYAILGGFYPTALIILEKMKSKELKHHLDY